MALPAGLHAAVEAAAVLEVFDAAALGALLETPAEALVDDLRARGLLYAEGAGYRLDAGTQEAALETLRETPPRQRDLYGLAMRYYAALLDAASAEERTTIERAYMRCLDKHCEALIQQAPVALAEVASAARLDLLYEPQHQHLLRFYRGLGAGLREDYAPALAEFERLLAEPGLDDAIRGRVLNSGATFARHQGDYERALEHYQQSYAIWERLGNRARQGLALMNQGSLKYLLQDYPAAEHDLHASLNLFREADALHSQALALMNLGLLARDLGRWQEALSYFDQAAEIFQREGATNSLGYIANNIGEVELLRGRLDAARTCFELALKQMSTRVFVVDVHLNLGLLEQAQGDDTAALDHYRIALDLAIELGRREIVALIRYRVGHAEQRLGQLDAARASYDAAVAAIEASRTPIHDEGLLISLMGRWQQVYEAVVQLCLERGDGAAAFDYAERARARAFADVLARRRALESAGDLDRASAAPVTASEVQAALPPGTLLLAYFAAGLRGPESALLDAIPAEAAGLRACLATPARLLLLALTHDSQRAVPCPLDPNVLQASSPYLADGRRFLNPAILRRAYDAVIAPVADLLAAAERVVVVPHGPLHQLPFAALLDPNGRPLLEGGPELACVPSATVLLRALDAQRTQPPQSCLALGYDGVAGRRLRHTEAEAAAVARLCGGVAWRGAPGMAAQLRATAGAYRWLHLACHGEFDLDDPLRSWLEIGPGERLSAADVIGDFRLDAELVVLSACRSGVSRVLRGDEPMGLVRAFLSAGARAVLMTLWPVEDSSARLLMERFYRALRMETAGDAAAALQVAQRYLRGLTLAEARDILAGWGEDIGDIASDDVAARPYADPAFWAAYTIVGARD